MKKTALALIVIAALLLSAIAVAIALNVIKIPTSTPAPPKPEYVTISGTANNTDHFDFPTSTITPNNITFTSLSNGTTYETVFDGGYYSISLPNENSYNVTINWQYTPTYAGDSYADTFILDTTEASVTKNWISLYQYPLKPEYVTVSGTAIRLQNPEGIDPAVLGPVKIMFKNMRDSTVYETRFYGGSTKRLPNGDYNATGNYVISLPNHESYTVVIRWQMDIIYVWDADAGTFNLNTTKISVTKNWSL